MGVGQALEQAGQVLAEIDDGLELVEHDRRRASPRQLLDQGVDVGDDPVGVGRGQTRFESELGLLPLEGDGGGGPEPRQEVGDGLFGAVPASAGRPERIRGEFAGQRRLVPAAQHVDVEDRRLLGHQLPFGPEQQRRLPVAPRRRHGHVDAVAQPAEQSRQLLLASDEMLVLCRRAVMVRIPLSSHAGHDTTRHDANWYHAGWHHSFSRSAARRTCRSVLAQCHSSGRWPTRRPQWNALS
jgi:hypothetical protein